MKKKFVYCVFFLVLGSFYTPGFTQEIQQQIALKDSINRQFGIKLRLPKQNTLKAVNEGINWVRQRNDWGYAITLFDGLIDSGKEDYAIVLGSYELKNNYHRPSVENELLDVFNIPIIHTTIDDDGTQHYHPEGIPEEGFDIKKYLIRFPRRVEKSSGADEIWYYQVPIDGVVFFKGLEHESSFLQHEFENKYPVLYRVFYFKSGFPVFDIIVMLPNTKGYTSKLNRIAKLFYY